MLQGHGTASSLHILHLLPSSAFPQEKKKNLHTLQIEHGQFLSRDSFRFLCVAFYLRASKEILLRGN